MEYKHERRVGWWGRTELQESWVGGRSPDGRPGSTPSGSSRHLQRRRYTAHSFSQMAPPSSHSLRLGPGFSQRRQRPCPRIGRQPRTNYIRRIDIGWRGQMSTDSSVECWSASREENPALVRPDHIRNSSLLLSLNLNQFTFFLSPPWPSGLKRWNQTLVPVVRARFEPRCGRPHFAPTRSGVRVCGRNRTKAREREWAEGTVSSLQGTLNVRIKFCHSTGIARSGGGVRASTTSYA